MSNSITNYDGGIVTTPQVLVKPKKVDELQEILRDSNKYPAPGAGDGEQPLVHACAASTGTVIDMSGLKAIVKIDEQAMTLTAQAGLQLVEASRELRKKSCSSCSTSRSATARSARRRPARPRTPLCDLDQVG